MLNTHNNFLIIKSTRCTNFSNLFLEWNSTCFGQFLCPSSGVFHCTYSNGICHAGLLIAFEQDHDGTKFHPDPARKLSANVSDIHLLMCVQWKTPDDGQRNCPKHVESHSKNKFEKLVHLVDFIIRNLARCTVTWTTKLTLTLRSSLMQYNLCSWLLHHFYYWPSDQNSCYHSISVGDY